MVPDNIRHPSLSRKAGRGFMRALRGLFGGGSLVEGGSLAFQAINTALDIIAFALPGLDRFTSGDWLVYHTGDWSSLAYVAGQTLVYLSLLAGAGLFDLYRKEF